MGKTSRVVGALGRVAAITGVLTVAGLTAPAAASPTPRSVLVVGDSVVAQAAAAIRWWTPPGTTAWPAGGPGTAPCDWWDGQADPHSGIDADFRSLVDQLHPAAVVLAFSGNPGLSGPPSGCVDANTRYSLAALLGTYRVDLTAMAAYASAHGARVYLAASPPRNPATPPGAYVASPGVPGYGFNGDPAFNVLYQQMAASPEGVRDAWTYDPAAAAAVSNLSLTWQLDETCMPWDVHNCRLPSATVQVRLGGHDAIHLDPYGNGAARYGQAIIRRPLEDQLG